MKVPITDGEKRIECPNCRFIWRIIPRYAKAVKMIKENRNCPQCKDVKGGSV